MNQLNALSLISTLLISLVVAFSVADSAPQTRPPRVEDTTEDSHPPRKLRRWIPTNELWVDLVPGRSLGDISFLVQELDLEPIETLDFDEFQIHWFRDTNGTINRTQSIDKLLAHRDLVAAAGRLCETIDDASFAKRSTVCQAAVRREHAKRGEVILGRARAGCVGSNLTISAGSVIDS